MLPTGVDFVKRNMTAGRTRADGEEVRSMDDGPRPGRRVRGSTTGRPIMAALDLLGRRWALRMLWELRDGPLGARALQERCDRMSSSVLYQRLADLGGAGLLAQRDDGRYELTRLGISLGEAIDPLNRWARTWAASVGPDAP
jgi:DNA-binding HxlR family transcriptional regulator